jgi:hypothetical protein
MKLQLSTKIVKASKDTALTNQGPEHQTRQPPKPLKIFFTGQSERQI